MALAIALNKTKRRKPWEMNPWDERAKQISLEEVIRQSNPSHNGHNTTGMAYVFMLPEISASSPIHNGMTAAEQKMWQDHWESVAEFNEWYANRGIEQVVENPNGLFGRIAKKVYDVAHGLSYVAGKAVSLVPKPVRYAAAPALVALAAACSTPAQAKSIDFQVEKGGARIEHYAVGDSYTSVRVFYNSDTIKSIDLMKVVMRVMNKEGTAEFYSQRVEIRNLKPNEIATIGLFVDVPRQEEYKVVVEPINYKDTDPDNNNAEVKATPTPDITPTPKDTPTKVPATPTPRATETPVATATPASLADLAFSNVRHNAGEWGEDYRDGRTYRVEFDVSNSGNIGSGTFYVSAPGLEQKLKFEGVASGKSLPVAFDLRLPSGKNSIDVVIEAENKASEKDGNNKYNLAIDVPEPPFKLVCDICTDEQKGTLYNNALEDYRKVLGVYGIKEGDARLRASVYNEVYKDGSTATRYSLDFFLEGRVGGAGGPSVDHFTTDRIGMRHEMGHAINHTLFPTKEPKDQDEPWYNTFDEGSASYASGMDGVAKDKRKIRLKDVDKEENVNEKSSSIYPIKEAYELLKQNPELYWKRRSGDSPGHATGADLYWFLIEIYSLTPEKNRIALGTLAEKYSETEKLTRKGIQGAYETGLGLTKGSLDNLFDLMEHGVRILYSGK